LLNFPEKNCSRIKILSRNATQLGAFIEKKKQQQNNKNPISPLLPHSVAYYNFSPTISFG